jgi:hypothetical protein
MTVSALGKVAVAVAVACFDIIDEISAVVVKVSEDFVISRASYFECMYCTEEYVRMMRTKRTKRSGRKNLRNLLDSDWKDLEGTKPKPSPNPIPDSFRLLSSKLSFFAGEILFPVRRRIIL